MKAAAPRGRESPSDEARYFLIRVTSLLGCDIYIHQDQCEENERENDGDNEQCFLDAAAGHENAAGIHI